MNRRTLLVGAGSIAAGSVAGCLQSGTGGEPDDGNGSTGANTSRDGANDGSDSDGESDPDGGSNSDDETAVDDESGVVRDWLVASDEPLEPDVTASVLSYSAQRQRELDGVSFPVENDVPNATGIEATDVDRVLFTGDLESPMGPLSYTVLLGEFEREPVVNSVTEGDDGGHIETRGDYELLAHGEESFAVADGRLVRMHYPYGENPDFPEDAGLVIDTNAGDRQDLLAGDPVAGAVGQHLEPGLFWQLGLLDPSLDTSETPFEGLTAWGRAGSGTEDDWTETHVYRFPAETDLDAAPIEDHASTLDGESVESVEHTVEGPQVVYEVSGAIETNSVGGTGAAWTGSQ